MRRGDHKRTLSLFQRSGTQDERARARALHPETAVERPLTRDECVDGPRPCPFVGCRHNLYLDVNPQTGTITLNHPDLEPWEVAEHQSCSLDVAEAGTLTLEEVSDLANVTRERIRQLEVRALLKLKFPMRVAGHDND